MSRPWYGHRNSGDGAKCETDLPPPEGGTVQSTLQLHNEEDEPMTRLEFRYLAVTEKQ